MMMRSISDFVEPIQTVKIAVIDCNGQMAHFNIETTDSGRECFRAAPIQMLYSLNFAYDVTNSVKIKNRFNDDPAKELFLAQAILECGNDLGLVTFKTGDLCV